MNVITSILKPILRNLDSYLIIPLLLYLVGQIYWIQLLHLVESEDFRHYFGNLLGIYKDGEFYLIFPKHFGLPMTLLGSLFAYIGFKAFLYRSKLAEAQNELSRRQVVSSEAMFETNRLNEHLKLYLEHRRYIFSELEHLGNQKMLRVSIDERKCYAAVFPNNRHQHFEVEDMPENLNLLVHRFNLSLQKLTIRINEATAIWEELTDNNVKKFHDAAKDFGREMKKEFEALGITVSVVGNSNSYARCINAMHVVLLTLADISNSKPVIHNPQNVLTKIRNYNSLLDENRRKAPKPEPYEQLHFETPPPY